MARQGVRRRAPTRAYHPTRVAAGRRQGRWRTELRRHNTSEQQRRPRYQKRGWREQRGKERDARSGFGAWQR
jgi:hypothetical protein